MRRTAQNLGRDRAFLSSLTTHPAMSTLTAMVSPSWRSISLLPGRALLAFTVKSCFPAVVLIWMVSPFLIFPISAPSMMRVASTLHMENALSRLMLTVISSDMISAMRTRLSR